MKPQHTHLSNLILSVQHRDLQLQDTSPDVKSQQLPSWTPPLSAPFGGLGGTRPSTGFSACQLLYYWLQWHWRLQSAAVSTSLPFGCQRDLLLSCRCILFSLALRLRFVVRQLSSLLVFKLRDQVSCLEFLRMFATCTISGYEQPCRSIDETLQHRQECAAVVEGPLWWPTWYGLLSPKASGKNCDLSILLFYPEDVFGTVSGNLTLLFQRAISCFRIVFGASSGRVTERRRRRSSLPGLILMTWKLMRNKIWFRCFFF